MHELLMFCLFVYLFFRKKTYNFNPLHKPHYNSRINFERKMTTITWVRLTNESVITWIIILLCQRAKWQSTFNQAARRAGAVQDLHKELSLEPCCQATLALNDCDRRPRVVYTKTVCYSSQQFEGHQNGKGIRERKTIDEKEQNGVLVEIFHTL